MIKRALIPVIPAVTALAFAAAPALADAPESVSANWAGYEISPNGSSGFSAASGGWVQPPLMSEDTLTEAACSYQLRTLTRQGQPHLDSFRGCNQP